ncbi:peptidylprolyl isomerase [Sphingomonas sp.]|uniref:peptidylprolyl isomerase n=1 Tax=Sphingomonas sp. TaxID=28214 RepID=UPI001B093984|nr:peptidylprolyl isomerase [Sphingomonas sp.]MBO9711834.1 peptidylprolyl isomerase [Sphingomonas sp.]
MGRKTLLALGLAALTTASVAQTVPDDTTPTAGLDLPANLQIFGKQDPNIRKPTAIVNDVVITGTDVDQRVAMVIALNNIPNLQADEKDRLRLQVLRSLIDETLQIQEAKADKIDVTKEDIDNSFARVSRSFQRTPEQMRTWLRQIGSSERSIKRQIEGELAWSRLLRRRVSIEVSDEEVNAILKRLQESKGTDEYRFYEIYMNATSDRASEVFAAEQRMLEQLKQGTPFEYLARTYSEASTKATGGDLGWVRIAMLPDQLSVVGQKMNVGEVAGPIELPTGFSILYLADKRQVLMADPRDAKLALKQLTIHFAKGTTEAQAQTLAANFAESTKTMQGCGDAARVAGTLGAEVVDNDSIRVRELPGPLQQMVLGLQVGQSTQPFGSVEDGVRVLVLCGRDDPTAANLPSAEQLGEQIAEQRTNLRAQRMLRDLRRDAIVEYR